MWDKVFGKCHSIRILCSPPFSRSQNAPTFALQIVELESSIKFTKAPPFRIVSFDLT